jgi:hypothetical protein
VKETSALKLTGLEQRLSSMLWITSRGVPLKSDESLIRLFKKTVTLRERDPPIAVLFRRGGDLHLTVRVPVIDEKDKSQCDNLFLVLNMLQACFNLNDTTLSITKDESLGTNARMKKDSQNEIAAWTASALSPKGRYPGGDYISKGGFKCNPVEAVAACRMLATYQGLLRKRPGRPQANGPMVAVPIVSQSDLVDFIHIKLGLKSEAARSSWHGKVMRWMVNALIRPSTPSKNFPNGWIYSVREKNNVTKTKPVLFAMGYTTKCIDQFRVKNIVLTGVKTSEDKKTKKLIPLDKDNAPNGISLPEFRTALLLSLPLIRPTCQLAMDKQLDVDPLDIEEKTVVESFNALRHQVDALNHAYACSTALKVRGTKAKPAHYEMARQSLIHATANVQFLDGDGNTYSKIEEIPENILGFFRKRYHYPKRDAKRKAETPPPTQEVLPPAPKKLRKETVVAPTAGPSTIRPSASSHEEVDQLMVAEIPAAAIDYRKFDESRWKPAQLVKIKTILKEGFVSDVTFVDHCKSTMAVEFVVGIIDSCSMPPCADDVLKKVKKVDWERLQNGLLTKVQLDDAISAYSSFFDVDD